MHELFFLGSHFHVGIVVEELESAVADVESCAGLTFAAPSRYRVPVRFGNDVSSVEFHYSYSTSGPPYLELMAAVPGTPWQPGGRASHHLGYWVDDLAGCAKRLASQGFVTIAEDAGGDVPRSFVMLAAPSTPFVVELVAASNRPALERWLGPGGPSY
jgi:hypothetical protein